ncbi:histidyl-tRNA synthetase [Phakopsora pachyrhizi]|uniref:histidine--tRNA ligase n=1 Tax=Phakopsora pachyrhizi TaxID=170000 RepID=A0AAV0BDW1_PHAPC|nr:histidyl-tRNA synthetase [Phakopsora pachyrhizi]CAH7683485.1 histidyl-tRNA synthetase [Phakopsora pachyrhizi]
MDILKREDSVSLSEFKKKIDQITTEGINQAFQTSSSSSSKAENSKTGEREEENELLLIENLKKEFEKRFDNLLSDLKRSRTDDNQKTERGFSNKEKSNKKEKSSKSVINLKVPKGTKDHTPREMLIRDQIFKTMTKIFKDHGGVTIDTPVFELREILSNKYGEDSKLIYDLNDQGGELCSLRYDLTVPFARFLAMNSKEYPNIKRYHIAKVYRRDQPAISKGRMREFYQCDFDIAGQSDPMISDTEILVIACKVLSSLPIGNFTIKLNHRKLLDGIFSLCGVPESKFRPISSAIDKLDKMSWEDVRKEMVDEKGLDPTIADRIGDYVKLRGSEDLLEKLLNDQDLTSNQIAKEGLEDMKLLFRYSKVFGILPWISFDLSLARGLDYYTGLIYEAVVEGSAPPTKLDAKPLNKKESNSGTAKVKKTEKQKKGTEDEEDTIDESQIGVGSIAAGGRYDNLVGMFSGRDKINCVGISFGVERIFSIMKSRNFGDDQKSSSGKEVDVYVMSVGDGLILERMEVCKELWDAGISAEFMYKSKPKTQKQFEVVDKERIRFAVILGPDELKSSKLRIKEQVGKQLNNQENHKGDENENEAGGESKNNGILIDRDDMVGWLKDRLKQNQIID